MDEPFSAFGLLIKEILENQRAVSAKIDNMATKAELALLKADIDGLRASMDTIKSSRLPNWLTTALVSGITSTATYILGNVTVSHFHR